MAELSLSDLGQMYPQTPPNQQSLADLGKYGPRVLSREFNTQLPMMDELQFRNWVAQNNVPFDPNAGPSDYDMRGFYQAAQQQQPGVTTAINPIDNMVHYPDRFKTPMHRSFSNESQWAGPNAPVWIDDARLALPNGRIVFDERSR